MQNNHEVINCKQNTDIQFKLIGFNLKKKNVFWFDIYLTRNFKTIYKHFDTKKKKKYMMKKLSLESYHT